MVDSVFVMPGTVAAPRTGTLRDLHSRYETVREALTRIDKAAREMGLPDISTRLIEDVPGERPYSPEVHYLEIFAVSLATYHLLVAEGIEPVAIVGQSIGELWALAAAGHVSVGDAARLAVARSQALTRQAWPGTMLAVGVDGRRAESLAGLIGHPHLVLACENTPRQSVLSGPRRQIDEAERVAEALGWPSVRLDVPHPTHTPAVAQAARDLRATAPRVSYGGGRWRVTSPWLGRDIGDEDPVELVAGALTAQVRMLHTVRALHAAGADTFIECGQWPVVTRFVEASVPGVQAVVPLSEHDPVAAVRALLASRTDTAPPPVRTPVPPPVPPSPVSVAPAPPVVPPAPVVPAPPVPAPAAPAAPAVPAPPPVTAAAPAAPSVLTPPTPQTAVTPASPLTVDPPQPAPDADQQYATVLAEIRALYGDYLGYPPELLGDDDGLESDLGVESLKQVALLSRVADRYGLPDLRANTSLLTVGTLKRIAQAVVQAQAEATAR
ncbi:acyltransferase domain-containing protein [Micromonospora sp. HUAS LYJ1]|uniref:acyltransferase domain-containing protein n=1 Tax=Micromonospora sp. HUAS LYJ1 TaxID=3061626 RepID=UPI002670D5A8|nr:acyltransferase domain-containing protein [Micromonospora sp. HUAS LYJ1]WKU05656.1 acyltransferase domain-containing protein [Micromonospora sp. HUAS LYJ1]